ncbi:MAG TPA: lysophospholipid acyltransferase family protein [Rhizomicrobium sp.]|nr:lysophospholipid acyltransferase family protein [Rhizomicrobium sp.]
MMELAPIPPMNLSQKLRYGAEAALFFAFMGFFRVLGVDAASALGGFMGREIFYRTGTMTRARNNLRAAFPEKTAIEIEAIIREMCDNLGRTTAEYAHLDKFRMTGRNPRLQIANIEIVDRVLASGKGILFISGHFANWEMMPFAAAQYGLEGGEVYRPLNNPYVDRWMVRQRMINGPKEQIAKGAQGTRRIFTLLRGGKCIYLLVDQKTNEGLAVSFFGRDAMTTPAPAALALKLGAILLPASNERLGGARFRMTVHEPIEFTPTGNHDRDVLALTVKINQAIEDCVRYRPSQWLWIHRRWPKAGDKPRTRRGREAQALAGAGVGVERDGSSLS